MARAWQEYDRVTPGDSVAGAACFEEERCNPDVTKHANNFSVS